MGGKKTGAEKATITGGGGVYVDSENYSTKTGRDQSHLECRGRRGILSSKRKESLNQTRSLLFPDMERGEGGLQPF